MDPEPRPFPIRIVNDPPPAAPSSQGEPSSPASGKSRSDEFYLAWDKFLAAEPKRAKKTSRAAREIEEQREVVEQTPGDGLQLKENAAKSWEEAASECKAKVAAIVEECKRLNQHYRDFVFDLEQNPYCLQSITGRFPKAVDKIDQPPWIKRVEAIFDDPQFFIDGATATDVHQGSAGDCWFLASLMAVTAKKELIEKLCVARDEKVGVYGFVFYRDGEWIHEVVDDKLFLKVGDDDDLKIVRDWDPEKKAGMQITYDDEKLKDALQRGGLSLYFSHCKSNETWLPLIEKAYAKAHGDYTAIEGGYASEGIEDLTGGVAVVLNPEDIMDKDRFWNEQLLQVNKKYLFGGGSRTTVHGFVGGHAYAVLEAWEEGDLRLLKLRNPWGQTEWDGDWSDGSKLWTADMMVKLNHTFGDDGVFWISYLDFLKHFTSINRVRLFDSDWSVGQQWTCVSVPWTVDYLDTKFQFTVSESGPAVIVLAQPDDRYFYGLRGRYLHGFHFRVYKEGDESRWIVRSMHNSGNESIYTRSVSAEIDNLEPGTYNVVFKITTYRTMAGPTAEEAIMKFAVDRKEKLLHVGRRFDYAQSKGDLRAMEMASRKGKIQSLKTKQKERWKKGRKVTQKERERERKRKQRIADAMREKRKAFEETQREKTKARQQRALARQERAVADASYSGEMENKEKDEHLTPESSDGNTVLVEKGDALESTEGESAETTDPTKTSNAAVEDKAEPTVSSNEAAQDVTTQLSNLDIQNADYVDKDDPGEPTSPFDEDNDGSDSSIELPEELDDDDFDWDSDMDGPVDSSDEEDERSSRSEPDIFGDDPWNALCVLGLRVYSKSRDVKVKVIKAENNA